MAYFNPNANQVALTRKQLYDQVWSEPMATLAGRYGISDVGLAKVCKKFNIPRPGRGYWAKTQNGQKVPKTPLPKFKGTDEIILNNDPVPKDPATLPESVKAQIEFEKAEENRIVLSPDLRRAHPLIQKTKELLSTIKPDEYGRVKTQAPDCLDIQVTQSSLRRAFLFMDTLIKACEKRGFEVKVVNSYREEYQTQIVVIGQDIQVRLDEKARLIVPT